MLARLPRRGHVLWERTSTCFGRAIEAAATDCMLVFSSMCFHGKCELSWLDGWLDECFVHVHFAQCYLRLSTRISFGTVRLFLLQFACQGFVVEEWGRELCDLLARSHLVKEYLAVPMSPSCIR